MRYISPILFLPLLFFFGCGRSEKPTSKSKLSVLCTIGQIYNLVEEVAGEHVENQVLIKEELDPHNYELVKGDDEKLASADIIFYNGLGLEHGYSLRHNLESNPRAYALGDTLLEKDKSQVLVVDAQFDPHIWMDIALWTELVDPLVAILSQKDPEHSSDFQKRGAILKEKMREADEKSYLFLQTIPSEKRFLVTSHNAFNYFARRYLAEPQELEGEGSERWRHRLISPEGLSPEAELSLLDIEKVLDHIVNYEISVLFSESNMSRDALKKIVQVGKQKGMALRLSHKPLYADAMGKGNSYLEMMEHNVSVIAEELRGR